MRQLADAEPPVVAGTAATVLVRLFVLLVLTLLARRLPRLRPGAILARRGLAARAGSGRDGLAAVAGPAREAESAAA